MEEALIARLLATAAVTAIFGTRITPVLRPQGEALPAATVQTVSGERRRHYQGHDELIGARVQIDCWGRNYAEAKTGARAVIAALADPFSSAITDIQGVFVDAERDGGEDASTQFIFRTSLDLLVWHRPI